MDWFKSLPKFGKIVIMVLLVVLLLAALYYILPIDMFRGKVEAKRDKVMLDVQDATVEEVDSSKISVYSRGNLEHVSDDPVTYWENLGKKKNDSSSGVTSDEDGVLRSDSGSVNDYSREVYLDPSIYSEEEIRLIRSGIFSKEEIDARHREAAVALAQSNKRVSPQMTQAQKDSAYFARVERAFEIARNYSLPSSESIPTEEEEKSVEVVAPKEELRVIETPTDTGNDGLLSYGGIVSSLDVESQGVTMQRGGRNLKPAKATFLRTERIMAGNRVTMRLMEDLVLSNGVVIPANTHIMGTCNMDGRMKVTVATVRFADKIFQCPLTVFDNDGVEGIYCPVFDKTNAKKAGLEVGSEVASGVASGIATVFGGRLFGRAAQQGVSSISSIALSDGSVAINIVSGYEFYLCEEIKQEGL